MIALERRDGKPLRIGHRGAAALAPENTVASFRAAIEAGVDLVELDVLRLESGELVVAHSDDLHEVSHGAVRGKIGTRTIAELRQLCPDLPTLDEALSFFAVESPETGVQLDLKSARAVDGVADALRGFGLAERSFVTSVHAKALSRLRRREPRIRTGIAFPQDRFGVGGRERLAPAVRAGLRALRIAAPALARVLLARARGSALVLHHELVTPAVVRRAHAAGAPVVAWTVDTRMELDRVDEAGVDAIVTNDPSIFVSTLMTS